MAYELAVFVENKVIQLESITSSLKKEGINIRSLVLNNIHHGWCVLNLLLDTPERAYDVLTREGYSVALQEVLALEMKDETGGLDELLITISKAGIIIDSAYTRIVSGKNKAILLIEVSDPLEALRRLEINGIKVLDDKVVYGE